MHATMNDLAKVQAYLSFCRCSSSALVAAHLGERRQGRMRITEVQHEAQALRA